MNERLIAPAQSATVSAGVTKDRLVLGGLLIAVGVGLVGLCMATGWQETLDSVSRLSLPLLVGLLLLSLVNYGLRSLRWSVFTRSLGLPTRILDDTRHYLGGFAMSVTPGRVGELVRMRWIRRETGTPFDKTAPLVLADRASDLAAMAAILAFVLLVSASKLTGALPVAVFGLIAAFVATRPALLRSTAHLGHRMTGKRFPRLFARVRRAAASLGGFATPMALLLAGLLGIVGWLAEGLAFYVLLAHLGADISLATAIGIFIFATLAGGLTGAPGGLGGAEAAMVALLTLDGVPLEIAVPATVIIRLTTLWFAIGIGLAVFPFAEKHSQKAQHALENN